jgi:ligand-binding sensor domain-containing protein
MTVNGGSFYLLDSLGSVVPATISLAEGNTIAYLDPLDSLAYSAVYTIVVTTAVTDLQGLHIEEGYTATFYTEDLYIEWLIFDTSNSGLPDNRIRSLVIDNSDNIWIGTNNHGIVMFDGINWRVYNTANSQLPSNEIQSIAIDDYDTKWIGTWWGGLAEFDGNNWTVYNNFNTGIQTMERPDCIAIDSGHNIWMRASGVAMYDRSSWTHYTPWNSSLPDTGISFIVVDYSNIKWFGCGANLVSFDASSNWMIYNNSLFGNTNTMVHCMAIDSGHDKWIGTGDWAWGGGGNGLVHYDGSNWTIYNTSNSGIPDDRISCIAIDGSNIKWFGIPSGGGLVRYDGNSWTHYTESNSPLPSNSLRCITVDSKDNKWIGTDSGIAVYNETGIIFP